MSEHKCRAGLYENTPDHHAIIGGCEMAGSCISATALADTA
ncbi:MAG: hypothetical protein WKF71_12870 [Pyrinomonadaceae bacterium]